MGDPRDIYPYAVPYAMVSYPGPRDSTVEEHVIRLGLHTYRQATYIGGIHTDTTDISEDVIFKRELWSTSQLVNIEQRIDSTYPPGVRNFVVLKDRDEQMYNLLWGSILKKAQYLYLDEHLLIPGNFRIEPCYPTSMERRTSYHHEPLRYREAEATARNFIRPGDFVKMSYENPVLFLRD